MKKALLFLSIFAIGFFLFTGQKYQDDSPRWNVNPAMTRMIPVGNYQDLPNYPNSNNYVNPNTITHYYNTPQGVMAVSPNFMVKPSVLSASTQSEVNIYSSLTSPNLVIASCNYFDGSSTFSTPGYISTNGGLNFTGNDISVSNYGDPAPFFDKNNNAIITFITLAGSMGSTRSVSPYTTWSAAYTFPGASTQADKNLSGTNYASSSPYYGHSYTVYTEFGGSYVNRIVFTRTTDGGLTWSTVAPVSPPTSSGHHHQGCDVTAGPEGNVYAIWANCTTNGQNSTEDSLGFAKSTDDGTTWVIATNHAADMNGIRNSNFGPWGPSGTGVRVAGFPRVDVDRSGGARNGWIYVVASEKTGFQNADASDVFLWRSTDLGVTWSAGIRVNQDPIGSGKLQYHAAVNVDAGGAVNVVYEDCRNSNANDSVETYLSRSVDGGTTWTDVLISDHKFRPAPISGTAAGYQGDYIGITSANNKIFPNWCENRSGKYQSWTAIVDIGPSIAHTPLGNTEQTTGNRVVNCVITPAGSPINPSTVKLYYSKDNPTLTTNVTMTNSSGDNWTANLPLTGAGLYRYYIIATDNLTRTATYPAGAPANTVSFTASSDVTPPVITHTPLADVPRSVWPATVTSTVTDNIGVDSVWVKWYKNNTGTGIKQFKLPNTTGSTFAAAFNSVIGDVQYNDSIFYKVYARDISSNHNADSTALNHFKIINLTNACIGTGTTASNYPFSTYWHDGRTQMLFTAAELNAAGAGPNSAIQKIGFNVISASSQLMNGFNVRFQHTTATSLTGYVTTGWTTGFSGTYTVPGTGWQYIDMTSPYFTYNGTSNLLIEVCYDNTSWTAYSTVNATSAPNMTWAYSNDNLVGCSITGGTAQAIRPNVCFTVTTLIGTGNNTSLIPNKFELKQNYPNPFNPTTKINFAIPKQGLVTMKIYDVLGREVRTLVNEVKMAGNYSVDFNASELSSGVYFYKIQSADFSDIKRMILIK